MASRTFKNALSCKVLTGTIDFNDLKETGLYYLATGAGNISNGFNMGYVALVVVGYGGNTVFQLAFKRAALYVRDLTGNPSSWSSWQHATLS